VSAGDPLRALQLFGAAVAARQAMALARMPADAPLVAMGMENARRAAGSEAEAGLAYGRTLSLDQARALALTVAASPEGT
jgi:hypothetical protein